MPIKRNTFITNGFLWYTERILSKKFDGVGIHSDSLQAWQKLSSIPKAIIYGTHSSWWDVMIAAFIAKRSGLALYAPMDAEQLKKYKILEQIGLFPVTSEMALGFVRNVKEIFSRKERTALFITPQGKFICNRSLQPEFQRGLATAVQMNKDIPVFAVSVQYEFWNESRAVIIFSVTEVDIRQSDDINELLRSQLQNDVQTLLLAASDRNDNDWTWLIRPKGRTLLIQDATSKVFALSKAQKYNAGHQR
jgi:hypothetical protein